MDLFGNLDEFNPFFYFNQIDQSMLQNKKSNADWKIVIDYGKDWRYNSTD